MRIIDVSNPTNPTEVGFYDTPWFALHVALSGIYAYVADAHEGLRIIDVSAPANPKEVGFISAGLPAGIYFYTLIAGDLKETRKLVVMR